MAHPPDVRDITRHAILARINSVANNGPELIVSAESPTEDQGLLY